MWKKNFRHRKLQTFMLFMIVLLSTLAMSGAISILISLDRPYHELAIECKSATADVWSTDHNNETIEQLGGSIYCNSRNGQGCEIGFTIH